MAWTALCGRGVPGITHNTTLPRLYQSTAGLTRQLLDYRGLAFTESEVPSQDGEEDGEVISRKALINMAIDAVPTRWYLSGIELERGLSISVDTVYLSHRAANAHSQSQSNVFWMPQFGLDNSFPARPPTMHENNSSIIEATTSLSLKELFEAIAKGHVKTLSVLDEENEICEEDTLHDRLGSLIRFWREES
jgi:hypothetical protein